MDYGDGTLNGEYQFNTQYRKAEMCATLQDRVPTCSAIHEGLPDDHQPDQPDDNQPVTDQPQTTTTTHCFDWFGDHMYSIEIQACLNSFGRSEPHLQRVEEQTPCAFTLW